MLHPHTRLEYLGPPIGYGVVATAPIPAGTIVWVRDEFDQRISPAAAAAMPEGYRSVLETYAYIDRRGNWVLCWDHARYINHSCEPSCLAPGAAVHAALPDLEIEVAVRDIAAGEELTDDYGTLNLERDMVCACRAQACRRVIRGSDFVRHADRWDAMLARAFPRVREVTQPLLRWLSPELSAALVRGEGLPSVLEHVRAARAVSTERHERSAQR